MKIKNWPMPRTTRWASLLALCLLASSCYFDDGDNVPDFTEGKVSGFKPVYSSEASTGSIGLEGPSPLSRPGKLVMTQDFLLINELEEGVHVIDNRNPANPQNIAFIRIPGNVDVAVKDDYIYADSYDQLVTLRYDGDTVVVVDRKEQVFENNTFPPRRGEYFECIDPSKGQVIRWIETTLESPKCYR